MGDHMKKPLAKPIIELEELYQGIPDDSVNLTFQDLADHVNAAEKKKPTLATSVEVHDPTKPILSSTSHSPSPLAKIPSLDFSTGLQATSHLHHNNHYHHRQDLGHAGGDSPWGHFRHRLEDEQGHDHFSHASGTKLSPRCRAGGDHGDHSGYSMGYDDMSGMSVASGRSGRRRRQGIPHSKICAICSNYIYIFRTRCLVCGRVFCRQCLDMGMGDMTEGRKCIECLGLRFSQRYIERAGKLGCCSWRYPTTMKQAELKWAEKGPRRSSDTGYGRSGTVSSTSRSPITPRNQHAASNEPSFVMSSPYSAAFSPHHLPL